MSKVLMIVLLDPHGGCSADERTTYFEELFPALQKEALAFNGNVPQSIRVKDCDDMHIAQMIWKEAE